MSLIAALALAWSAVHTYVVLHAGSVYLRHRGDRLFLNYALLSMAFAAFGTGESLLISAESVAEGAFGLKVVNAGAAIALAALVSVCQRLADQSSRLALVATAWGAVGFAANAAGLFVDPAFRTAHDVALISWAPTYREPELTIAWAGWSAVGCVIAAIALARVVRRARGETELRVFIAAFFVAVIAAIHDVVLHAFGLQSLHLLNHAAALTTFASGYVLVRRFVRVGDVLDERTAELEQSLEDLQDMQQELIRKEQLAAVGELSRVIAHEVRNPLAILKNAISGLGRARIAPVDRETLLEILDEEADRLNRLVGDLLAYARPVEPRDDPLEVEELVEMALAHACSKQRATDVQIRASLAEAPATLHGDPELLRRALVNVLDNAMRAARTGGSIRVLAELTERLGRPALGLRISDNGEGMSPEVLSKARDPFFTTRPTGTGLGLAIVERVVRAHGGSMDIDSSPGRGTTVTLVLPLHRPGRP